MIENIGKNADAAKGAIAVATVSLSEKNCRRSFSLGVVPVVCIRDLAFNRRRSLLPNRDTGLGFAAIPISTAVTSLG